MNRKITETEFKNWSEQLGRIYDDLLKNSSHLLFQTEQEKELVTSAWALGTVYTKRGVLVAILGGLVSLENVALKDDGCTGLLDGLTYGEWKKKITQRVKEHCIANGYYDPNSPPDLTLLKTRRNKVNKILKDNNQFYKLLTYADSEDYQIITATVDFFNLGKKLVPSDNDGDNEDIPRKIDFLVEDHVGRVEKLVRKKEQAEKNTNNGPASPTSNSPTSQPSSEYKSNLETEIGRLQQQISELEGKINDNTANSTQKETYQKILDNTKKDLGDRQKEKDKLGNKPNTSEPSNKSNNKLNWAIGLGIGVIVISLICLILLANRRKES